MLVNFGLSSIHGTADQSGFLGFVPPALQNLLHMPFYGLLVWLWYRSFRGFARPRVSAISLAVFISIVWGALDELHQYFVPGRYATLTDLGFDAAGVLIVAAILFRGDEQD